MSSFTIPRGVDFMFTIQIFEEDSFLPQDLSDFVSAGSEFILMDKSNGERVNLGADSTVELSLIAGDPSTPEVTEFRVAYVDYGDYTFKVEGTTYTVSYERSDNAAPTTSELAQQLRVKMSVMGEGLTASGSGDKVVITNATGALTHITASSNIAQTDYVPGTRSDSAYYRENGYLRATITADQSKNLIVLRGDKEDNYPLQVGYQALLRVNFSSNSPIRDRTTLIEDVYVMYAGGL